MKKFLVSLIFIASTINYALADVRTAVRQLQQTMTAIEYLYVDTANSDKLSEVGIRAILKELDPHSTYLTPDEVKAMTEDLGGNFQGIGVRYSMESDTLYIINTVVGGPSEKVGILAGDRIMTVNDSVIAGKKFSNTEIQRRLRGPKGSVVKLGIARDGVKDLIIFNVTRDDIPVYSIDASYMVSPTVGYIKISRFALTTPAELKSALEKLNQEGMKDVIIDLQDNGGGYLQSAVEMANLFIEMNKTVVYTMGRMDNKREYRTSFGDKFEGKIVVLIDEESASASEIFSGAIQDLDRGVIVGRRSFGKGLVQRPIDLAGGGMIRLTVSHYYTPSGRCIQKPYTKGDVESYSKDLINRYNRGELLSADSIQFADSLKYTTEAGRTVYGGGGIMPDIFVPIDTLTKISPNHRTLLARGLVAKYTLEYFKQNQKDLHKKYETFDSFNEGFEVSDDMIADLCKMATADTVKLDSTDVLTKNILLKSQIKGNIAADLFETGAYSQVMNFTNNIFKEGLNIITDDKKYNDILKPKKDL